MDYELLSQEIIRQIRGRRSQLWLSQRLGFGANQLYRWESGLRSIDWPDFLSLAIFCEIDLSRILRDTLGYATGLHEGSGPLVLYLLGDVKTSDAASALGVSAQVIRRWSRGSTPAKLSDILHMLDVFQGRMLEVLDGIGILDQLPSLSLRAKEVRARKELSLFSPVAILIVAALSTRKFQQMQTHSPGCLAQYLGISLEMEEAILKNLLQAGSLLFENGKYSVTDTGLDLKSKDASATIKQRLFWAKFPVNQLQSAKNLPVKSLFGWSVFAVSPEGFAKIQEKLRETYAQITAIANADRDQKDGVKVINLQCIDLDEYLSNGSNLPRF